MLTLIFDGDCGFCTSTANRMVANSKVELNAIPWQFANLGDFGLTANAASRAVYLWDDGQLFAGHLAFAHYWRRQPQRLKQLAAAAVVSPLLSPAFALGYRLVARYRHRLPGGTPACQLPRG
jgi:predicted DCC family thiol-disulfide oxidoreductase YuxK